MGYKGLIKKFAKFILVSQAHEVVNIKIDNINYGGILANKKIVVTGGGSGLGFAMARKFVSEGADVLITGRNEEKLKKACATLGASCQYKVFDVTKIEDAATFVEACYKLCGGFDTFVLNAGVSLHEGSFHNVTIEGFDVQFNTNLKATYFLSKAFLEQKLEKKEEGNLLIVSSNTSAKSIDIPYGITKAAINSMTGALARRVYKKGIRVNAIAPGVTLTDMTKDFAVFEKGNYANNSACGSVFLPEEVAEVACFMISDASKCISGEVVFCDAGNHLNVNFK